MVETLQDAMPSNSQLATDRFRRAGGSRDDGAALHFRGANPRALLKIPGTVGFTFVSAEARSNSPVELVEIRDRESLVPLLSNK